MSENINPLMDFARIIECSIKLPSNGSWYDDDNISFNSIGEVDIKAMLPKDELLLTNPESLISGETIIQVIKSCCPGIKRPEELYYPDVNALLLGIHKATYGDEIKLHGICPNCTQKRFEEYTDLLNKKIDNKEKNEDIEKITEEVRNEIRKKYEQLEKDNVVDLSYQEMSFNIDYILSQMKFLPTEYIYESGNGLKIYLTPYKCKDKSLFMMKNNQVKKMFNNLREKVYNASKQEEGYDEKINELNKTYVELSMETLELLSTGIKKIEIPNGMVVTNEQHIKEFVMNSSTEAIKDLNRVVEELTSTGLPKTLTMKCRCCEHEWEEVFHKYNPSDFFGISS